jgi:hypothetical protein
MPYKRLSRLGWTFSIPKSAAVFSESDFFNTHTCIRTLRFTVDILNFIFVCAFYVIPFLAIRPVLRLHQRPRIWGLVLLTPLLLLSSFLLLGTVVLTDFLAKLNARSRCKPFNRGAAQFSFKDMNTAAQ